MIESRLLNIEVPINMMCSRISILIFFIVIIQTVAFQQVNLHHTNTHTIKTNVKCRRNDMNMKLMGQSIDPYGEEENSPRRTFLRQSLLSLIVSSTAMTASSDKTEAASTSGYIPDMVGGLKKPKGVGGLTKKIRKVGDVMVSYIETLQYLCPIFYLQKIH